jgi:hypothetical protein
MKKIKLWYSDFYQGFDPKDNYLHDILSRNYNVVLDPDQPDFLIYSCYGKDFLKYRNSVKVFFTGENLIPDFNLCDYGIGFSYLEFGDRYLRYPNFALIEDQFEKLLKFRRVTSEELKEKPYFCNFIYSNSKADPARDFFFQLLNKYKEVLSPGSHLNNTSINVGERFTEDWMYTKLTFQSKCKFSVAFENSSSPGYTTEKLMHAYITNTIPIYWGNPEVTRDFNPKSIINCHDFGSFEEVVGKIAEIDNNEQLALKYLNEPPFRENRLPLMLEQTFLEKFLCSIFDQAPEKAFRRPQFGTTMNYEQQIRELSEKKNRKKTGIGRLLNFALSKG